MEHGPGTNYFASLNGQVFISQTDQDGLAVLANCYGDPNSIALDPNIFAVGCQMIRKDILSGNNVYYNQGTVSSVSWVLSGGGGGGNSFDSNRNTTRAGIPIVDVGGTTVQ
jgi:hypothetical protein